MQSRRDQVQAHLFVMSRLASGMQRGEPDAPDAPHVRTTRGTSVGVALGMAVVAGLGVFGLISPAAATALPKVGTLVVVNETGARYLSTGGALHPVLNEASAKLLEGDQMAVQQMSLASLQNLPMGAPVGIVGAPDGLPAATGLVSGAWSVCGVQKPGTSTATVPQTVLSVGRGQAGMSLTAGQGTLVVTPDGTVSLLWDGQRLTVDTADSALQALGYAQTAPTPVAADFLDALPAGPELGPPAVAERGSAGPVLAGARTRIGQLFSGPSGGQYLLTTAGLVPLTTTQLDLLRGDPHTQQLAYQGGAVTLLPLGPEDLAVHLAAGAQATAGLPATPPTLVAADQSQAVCADVAPGAASPVTTIDIADAQSVAGTPPVPMPGVAASCTAADAISVPAGGGALVRAVAGGGSGATEYLVTDTGVKYPLPSADVAKTLGYGAVVPAAVPDGVLGFLPTGPSLDPTLLGSGGVVQEAAQQAHACP